ncbi:Uncharacterised protein [Escherichia coli]|uniref:Uncharacterized protein n=1 Tax=Escherichia coli TaxID=562 RepID=A0A376PNI5_ECOLX|nr:Uncharacterised protein [Escherichia coli]
MSVIAGLRPRARVTKKPNSVETTIDDLWRGYALVGLASAGQAALHRGSALMKVYAMQGRHPRRALRPVLRAH